MAIIDGTALLIGSASLATGVVLVIYVSVLYRKWRRVRDWPTVTGHITHRGTRWEWLYVWPVRLKNYFPVVAYQYAFREYPHSGQKISVRDRSLASVEKSELENLVDGLPVDSPVFVNPMDSAEAYLRCDLDRAHLDYIATYGIVGVLLAAIGVWFVKIALVGP